MPAEDLPWKITMLIKVIGACSSFAVMAFYAWLNVWMGLDTLMLLVVGLLVSRASLLLMARLSARLASESSGSIREGVISNRFRLAAVPGYLALLAAVAFVVWDGYSAGTFGWRNTSAGPALVLGGGIFFLVWTRRVQVRLIPAARPSIGKRKPPREEATTAVIVVHGIGLKKAGDPLKSVAGPIEQFLYRQAPGKVMVQHQTATVTQRPSAEFLYQRKVKGSNIKQRVLMTEVLWADSARRPGGLRTAGWVTWTFPMLMAMILAPDRRDIQDTSVMRLAYRIALPLIFILSILQPGIRLWALGAVTILLVTTIFRRTNLLGDVEVAATSDAEVRKITASINSAIDDAFGEASRVVVVGHSQGGYLSYRALQERTPAGRAENIHLVGIGSGLKPIWLLRNFNDRRTMGLMWLLIVGGLAVYLSLAPIFLGLLQYQRPFLVDWMSNAAQSFIVAQSKPVPFGWRLFLPWSTQNPWAAVPDYKQIGLFTAGLVLILLVQRKAGPLGELLRSGQLRRPPAARQWTEITSSVDSVGRLALPRIPQATVWSSPSLGNALLDHVSYFRQSSPVAWYLGCALFAPIVGSATPVFRQWAQYLDIRIWRARVFAALLSFVLIGVYAINRLNPYARGMSALIVPMRHPGSVLVGLLCITLVSPALGIFDRFRMSAAMARHPVKHPPQLRKTPVFVRMLSFIVWASAGAFAGACFRHLVRYSPMTSTEVRLLPVAPLVMSAMLFALAAALAAGYRLSWLAWLLAVLPFIYWSSYLPGQGPVSVFLDFMIVLTAVFSMLAFRFFSRPVGLPDSAWPGYRAAGARVPVDTFA
jgi:hypothetical protein